MLQPYSLCMLSHIFFHMTLETPTEDVQLQHADVPHIYGLLACKQSCFRSSCNFLDTHVTHLSAYAATHSNELLTMRGCQKTVNIVAACAVRGRIHQLQESTLHVLHCRGLPGSIAW